MTKRDAMLLLKDKINRAVAMAQDHLSRKEIAAELRRIAGEIESEE